MNLSYTVSTALKKEYACRDICSCGSNLQVENICKDTECPNHETQRLYCKTCRKQNKKHVHEIEEISDAFTEIDQKWNSLR
jgi:predicted RNA-binding Zn-ribbon protein involved in translation (DUF1610 family)